MMFRPANADEMMAIMRTELTKLYMHHFKLNVGEAIVQLIKHLRMDLEAMEVWEITTQASVLFQQQHTYKHLVVGPGEEACKLMAQQLTNEELAKIYSNLDAVQVVFLVLKSRRLQWSDIPSSSDPGQSPDLSQSEPPQDSEPPTSPSES